MNSSQPELTHTSRAYFRVTSSSMTLDEMIGVLGVAPSSGWSNGDRVTRGNGSFERVMTFSSWTLESPLGLDAPMHEKLESLYEPVLGLSWRLSGHDSLRCTLQLVQYFSEPGDLGFNLSNNWLSLLAAVGAEFDVDQYR
ncbi:DUF4279 domain-containing protein [Microbacterium hydrocarbonoxydans]|uniref:DUF4279 domain-containing protein n=2 Tax=Microbacterium hydrocarbonoxydans TaxID=273678 RepID=UPI0009EA3008